MRTILIIFRACALIAYALLLIIHFVLKDHFRFFQVYFYAFPLPILVFMGFVITLLFYRPRSYFIFFICFTLGLTAIWLNNSYIFHQNVDVPKEATSVLFWNTADRAHIPREILTETIKDARPEIIALVEAENAIEDDVKQLSADFPEYEFRILEGNMFVGVKGRINSITFKEEPHSYDINFIDLSLDSGSLMLALTDTFQDPSMDKRKTLSTILKLSKEKNTDLMVGDFNTPYESVHFRPFEDYFTSFHDYGQGFSATWLFGVPLLEIDLVWLKQEFRPLLLQKFNYRFSDHAMLIAYFEI